MPGFWICHNMAGDDDDKLFCGMVDRRKAFSLISSWSHCQRSSPSWISDALQAGFEPVQNLSSGFVEWRCVVVIAITPRRHYRHISTGRIWLDMSKWDMNMSECMITDRVLSMSYRIHSVWHSTSYWVLIERLAYSEPYQRSRIERLGKIIITFKHFWRTIF